MTDRGGAVLSGIPDFISSSGVGRAVNTIFYYEQEGWGGVSSPRDKQMKQLCRGFMVLVPWGS